jgi:carbon-monoxide dehydrogenase medium subunit
LSAQLIGGVQVQNRASLGGNICNAAPSADGVPALICLAARAVAAGPAGRREMAVEEVFAGPGRTSLAAGELLVAIRLPPPAPRSAACYLRFTPRREMDIAVAGSGVWLRLGEDGAIADARIVLASVAPTPIRAPAAERKLVGEKPGSALFEEAGRLAAKDARPISDTRGSADYRRTLVAVLTARALADCCRQLDVEVIAR